MTRFAATIEAPASTVRRDAPKVGITSFAGESGRTGDPAAAAGRS